MPSFTIRTRLTFQCSRVEIVPTIQKLFHVTKKLGLKFYNAALRENVGYYLALASVIRAVASIEQSTLDRDEGVVELRLESAIAVGVDDA